MLTEEQKEKICDMYKQKETVKDIADKIGCSRPTVYDVLVEADLMDKVNINVNTGNTGDTKDFCLTDDMLGDTLERMVKYTSLMTKYSNNLLSFQKNMYNISLFDKVTEEDKKKVVEIPTNKPEIDNNELKPFFNKNDIMQMMAIQKNPQSLSQMADIMAQIEEKNMCNQLIQKATPEDWVELSKIQKQA